MSTDEQHTPGSRIQILEHERARELERLAQRRAAIRRKHESKDVRDMGDTFVSHSQRETVAETLSRQNMGLRTLNEFQETRDSLVMASERERRDAADRASRAKRERKRARDERRRPLSFSMDEEDEEEEGAPPARTRARLGKDPTVDTHFLPDREREEWERTERDRLRREFMTEQDRIKAEEIEVAWSFWDGSGHRRATTIRKGASVAEFLDAARREFRELARVAVDDLLFVKEDVILPHEITFYDMMVSKARGKSGPLFSFAVVEDVRLVVDARIPKAETHAGKVVDRHWYEKNKHIFPASRWEIWDPARDYDKQTLRSTDLI